MFVSPMKDNFNRLFLLYAIFEVYSFIQIGGPYMMKGAYVKFLEGASCVVLVWEMSCQNLLEPNYESQRSQRQ